MRKLIGQCGVDSGQIMLVDPCYLSDYKADDYKEDAKEGEFSYSGACKATLSDQMAGQLTNEYKAKIAVVTSTGLGDGLYNVYAEYSDEGSWGKRVKRVTIEFLEDDEPDGSEESWESRNRWVEEDEEE